MSFTICVNLSGHIVTTGREQDRLFYTNTRARREGLPRETPLRARPAAAAPVACQLLIRSSGSGRARGPLSFSPHRHARPSSMHARPHKTARRSTVKLPEPSENHQARRVFPSSFLCSRRGSLRPENKGKQADRVQESGHCRQEHYDGDDGRRARENSLYGILGSPFFKAPCRASALSAIRSGRRETKPAGNPIAGTTNGHNPFFFLDPSPPPLFLL